MRSQLPLFSAIPCAAARTACPASLVALPLNNAALNGPLFAAHTPAARPSAKTPTVVATRVLFITLVSSFPIRNSSRWNLALVRARAQAEELLDAQAHAAREALSVALDFANLLVEEHAL